MTGRRGGALGVMGAVLVALALPGAASSAPATPRPTLSAMALQASDLPADSEVAQQGYGGDSDFVASYSRSFALSGGRVGRSTPLLVTSEVGLTPDAKHAAQYLAAVRLGVSSKATRRAFVRELAGSVGTSPRNVRLGPLRTIRAGDAALAWQMTVRTKLGSIQFVLGVAVVDRVVCSIVMASEPHKRALVADAATLVAASADHAHQGLLPKSVGPPALAGGAQIGQTLTAAPGAWSPATAPTAYAYQWQRCDPTGAACAPIPGATGQAYAVTADDAGATIRVDVTASNRIGATTAVSAVTAPVAA
jgi:hypothetical protein